MSTELATVNRVKSLLATPSIKDRFNQVLGTKSAAFMSSIISAVSSNKQLATCDPMSVIASAAVAASMDLPINPSLGFAHIVGYGGVAQFQMGWKGFVQLAMRTGQYKTINATEVYEGQITDHNPFTGKMTFNNEKTSDKIIGYLLYFELVNGFEKYFYMTKDACEKHGKRYSQSYKKGFGQWKDNFDAMALKTVVKLGLSKYGILSTDMAKALDTDQAEVTIDGDAVSYPDAAPDAEYSETPPAEKKQVGAPNKLKKALKEQAKSEPNEEDVPDPTNDEEIPI